MVEGSLRDAILSDLGINPKDIFDQIIVSILEKDGYDGDEPDMKLVRKILENLETKKLVEIKVDEYDDFDYVVTEKGETFYNENNDNDDQIDAFIDEIYEELNKK